MDLFFATRKIEKRLATPESRQREYGQDAARDRGWCSHLLTAPCRSRRMAHSTGSA